MEKIHDLTNAQLESLIALSKGLIEGADYMTNILAIVAIGLEELLRMRQAVSKHATPLVWRTVLDEIGAANQYLANHLKDLDIKEFSLGHLSGLAKDNYHYTGLDLFRGILKSWLENKYGVKFRIKFLRPG